MHLPGEQCRPVDNAMLRSDRLAGILTASRGRIVDIAVGSTPSKTAFTAALHR